MKLKEAPAGYERFLWNDFSTPEQTKGGQGSGNFGHEGRPGLVGGAGAGNGLSRSERAKATHKPVTKAKRRTAIKQERKVTQIIGGTFTGDNLPFDVRTATHGIEVKSIFPGAKNPKITMHKSSLLRKVKAATQEKLKAATIAIDLRDDPPTYYYKAGVGSFRLGSMARVTENELREIFK
jgi:hypothetical protein